MRKSVDAARYMLVLKEASRYISVSDVLASGNLTEYQDTGAQYLLKCPYHDDAVPSFRIDKDKGFWHCFSCGRGGTLLKLLHYLLGSTDSMSGFADTFLKGNELMKRDLGFVSIFSGKDEVPEEFKHRRIFNRQMDSMTMPVSTLVNRVKSLDKSYSGLATMLTLMQSGVPSKDILNIIQMQSDIGIELDSEEIIDIAELVKE